MTRSEVTSLVDEQIGGDWGHSNLHGVDLRRCLVEPRQLTVFDAQRSPLDVWLVLEEVPGGPGGYVVVYEEESACFGLVTNAHRVDALLIGLYGSFFDALDAM
jgi:hypothetical protein